MRRVSALSLPMLLRVMNYPEQALDDLPAGQWRALDADDLQRLFAGGAR